MYTAFNAVSVGAAPPSGQPVRLFLVSSWSVTITAKGWYTDLRGDAANAPVSSIAFIA